MAPKTITKTHVFRRDWTTPSLYDDIYYNLNNAFVLGDQYDHCIRTSIFHFDNEQQIHRSSRNHNESECKVRASYLCAFLNHVFHILELVGYVVEKVSHLVQLGMRHSLCWYAPLT